MFKKISKSIAKVKDMSCTLRGRVLTANTVLYPNAYFTARTYPHTKGFLREIVKQTYSFLYGEGQREAFQRKVNEIDRRKGGMDLDKIGVRCESMFFVENFLRPGGMDFNHQRKALFRYFFSFQMTMIFAHLFTLGEPHCLHLPPAYLLLKDIWSVLSDHDVALQTAMVSANQIFVWLVGESDFEVKCKCFIDDRALYSLWREFSIPVREIDFLWRVALGVERQGILFKSTKSQGRRWGACFVIVCWR